MISLPDVLQTAIQHHQAGRLQEAEALYRQILQVEPNHPDALHLLGVIAHQAGKHEIALEYIARAIALNPAAEYHNNIGEAYRALARLNEAGASFQQALARSLWTISSPTGLLLPLDMSRSFRKISCICRIVIRSMIANVKLPHALQREYRRGCPKTDLSSGSPQIGVGK